MIEQIIRIRRFAGSSMAASALLADAVGALLFAILALTLWSRAGGYVDLAGGMPSPSIAYAKALIASEGLHLRLFWWGCAWAAGVFAVGSALLAVAGGHRVWATINQMLSR